MFNADMVNVNASLHFWTLLPEFLPNSGRILHFKNPVKYVRRSQVNAANSGRSSQGASRAIFCTRIAMGLLL